jgi:hypothetical protein
MNFRRKLLSFPIANWRNRTASAVAVLIVTAGGVHADVRVSGDAAAVRLNATRSTVAEALSALESAFGLRVNASIALDRDISGTYAGALPEILSHLLQGYNYVIRRQATDIEVTVVGLQNDRAATVERPRLPPGNNPALSLADAVRLKIH